MRSIFAAIIIVSASTAVVHAAEAQKLARNQPAYGYRQAPIGGRQPTQDDVRDANQVQKDNELLDLPPTQDKIIGADQLQSEDNALAKTTEQENARLDREIREICRGC